MKIAMGLVVLAATITLTPTFAFAWMNTSHLGSDSELIGLLSDTLLTAEGRIGDLGGAATFELDLGTNTSDPIETAQYDWQSGNPEPFTLTFDSGTSLVTFTLGGVILQYYTPFNDFTEIFVRTRAVNDSTGVTVTDLVLDGEAVGDYSSADGPDGLDILWISGAYLLDGFTLAGTATLSWTGAPPSQSRLAFQIKVAKMAVIGTGESSWGKIKSLSE